MSHLNTLAYKLYSLVLKLVVVLFLATNSIYLQAAALSIPLNQTQLPANDLVYKGEPIDAHQALEFSQKGLALWKLNPRENLLWKDTKQNFSVAEASIYPAEGSRLDFDFAMLSTRELFRSRVHGQGQSSGPFFTMTLSLNNHAALLQSALLRKVGYQLPLGRYYKKLELKFSSLEEKETFLKGIRLQTMTSLSRWIVANEAQSLSLTLRGAVLEPARINIHPVQWGVFSRANVQGRRVFRSLIIPYVLGDLPEHINKFAWSVGSFQNENIVLEHFSASQFADDDNPAAPASVTLDDARWMMNRIAQLNRADFKEIAEATGLPEDIQLLLSEKLIARRNRMLELLSLQAETRQLEVFPQLTLGNVKKGQLVANPYADDYACELLENESLSPLRSSELWRWGKVQALGTIMSTAVSMLSRFGQYQTINEIIEKRRKEVMKDGFANYAIQQSTGSPVPLQIIKPSQTWGGDIGGVKIITDRSVMTGNYYGNNASIQLVDTLGFEVKTGYFMTHDQKSQNNPSALASLSLSRYYTHVKPVTSMEQAEKESWKNVYVLGVMHKLADLLALDERCISTGFEEEATKCQKEQNEVNEKKFKEFLEEFKIGEALIISDAVRADASASVTFPIAQVLDAGGVTPYVAGAVNLTRKTTLVRTPQEIQIYLSDIGQLNGSMGLNVSFYFDILQLKASTLGAQGNTIYFKIPTQDLNTTDQTQAMLALKALLGKNNTELVAENYPAMSLKHKVGASTYKALFFYKQWDCLDKDQEVIITPPMSLKDLEKDGKKWERVLYQKTVIDREGNNYLAVLAGLIRNVSQGLLSNIFKTDQNPGNTPYGRSSWLETTTEGELTEGRALVPMVTHQNVWSGWSITKDDLQIMINEIEKKSQSLHFNKPLIDSNLLAQTNRLELYEIKSLLVLYPSSVEKLGKALLLNGGDAKNFLIHVMGGPEYLKFYCSIKYSDSTDAEGVYQSRAKVRKHCFPGWASAILASAKKFKPEKRQIIEWTNETVHSLLTHAKLERLLEWLGKENYYYLVTLNGYKEGDRNSQLNYVSDTLGQYDNSIGLSIFKYMSSQFHISAFEMYAKFFNPGF